MSQTTHDPSKTLKDYILIIKDLISTAASIARTEEIKTAAVSERRHELLDDCIQEEQALLLKLRGLEQHRIKLQKELGWDGFTLSQILEQASPEQAESLSPVFQELDQQLRRLQTSREAAEQILKVRLHELEIFSGGGAAYDNGGNLSQNSAPQSRIRNTYG